MGNKRKLPKGMGTRVPRKVASRHTLATNGELGALHRVRFSKPSSSKPSSQGDEVMNDPTEAVRREMVVAINSAKSEREKLEEAHGQVWDTKEMTRDFGVTGFMAPLVVVKKKDTGEVGSLMFQHSPRYYWGWTPDEEAK